MGFYLIEEKIKNNVLRALLSAIMSTVSGHDHDGTNSKAVTTGTPGANTIDDTMLKSASVTTAKIASDALSANAAGLLKMADGYLSADAGGRAKMAAGFVTLVKMDAVAKYRILNYQVENLSAGADFTARAIFVAPAGLDVTLVSASIISHGTPAGVDDANTCVITLADGSANSIVAKTYNTGTAFPAENAISSLGALDGTYKILSAGEKLTLAVTNGVTSDPPAFMLQVVYSVADAA